MNGRLAANQWSAPATHEALLAPLRLHYEESGAHFVCQVGPQRTPRGFLFALQSWRLATPSQRTLTLHREERATVEAAPISATLALTEPVDVVVLDAVSTNARLWPMLGPSDPVHVPGYAAVELRAGSGQSLLFPILGEDAIQHALAVRARVRAFLAR